MNKEEMLERAYQKIINDNCYVNPVGLISSGVTKGEHVVYIEIDNTRIKIMHYRNTDMKMFSDLIYDKKNRLIVAKEGDIDWMKETLNNIILLDNLKAL